MTYLVDTNVVSELARRKPAAAVLRWLDRARHESIHLGVLTHGELHNGVERLLPVSAEIADPWGRLVADSPPPLPVVGSLLAATALHHGLRLVTRNVSDFRFPGLTVVNPWTGDP